jgi:NADPH:quinone reductase-like Zn-dependent oxidoreductase
VPGLDLVGTVSAVYAPHDCQARFKEGDKVVALVVFSHILSTGRGALAGQVAIPARYAVQVPAGREERDVAGLLVAGCTAMKMVDDAALENGQRVLIVGGSGGVGSMTLQMARHGVGLNGLVVSICSAQSDAMVRQLGAHEVSVMTSSMVTRQQLTGTGHRLYEA